MPVDLAKMDLVDRIREHVGETGIVRGSYGGMEIVVKGAAFPWNDVMTTITSVGQDVWVSHRDGELLIRSKPPSI